MITLDVQTREKNVDLEALRNSGFIPAVFYGPQIESTSITINTKDFSKLLEEAGESTVVTLKTKSGDKDALIHAVDTHPVTGFPLHVDFYVFDKTQKVEVPVEIEFIGVSPAVKEKGGILVKVLHEITISALPQNLPQHISVDITPLVNLDSVIMAKDIILPSGVELAIEADEVVVAISEAKEETETATPINLESVKVVEKGKKDKEEEAK